MFPLWLLPLGFFALSRGRTIKYKKPVTSNTGLIFSCSKIEILNQQSAYRTIDYLIEEFKREKKYLGTIDVFDFILKKLDICCYKKLKSRTLSQREKVIISLLFIIIFNRLIYFAGEEKLFRDFEEKDRSVFMYLLDLSEDDVNTIEIINNRFNQVYSYP